jgi:hypothetical protein
MRRLPERNAGSTFQSFQSFKVFETLKLCHFETLRSFRARNDIAFRSGFAKTPNIRRMPKRKTEN